MNIIFAIAGRRYAFTVTLRPLHVWPLVCWAINRSSLMTTWSFFAYPLDLSYGRPTDLTLKELDKGHLH